jgi:hypothetical protein
VAPFRNPLALPDQPTGNEIAQERVRNYNNAWLRSVAYRYLFGFQTLGLGLFSAAVLNNRVSWAAVGLGVAVALLGPHEPRLTLTRTIDGEKRPVLPLSWSLFLVFLANAVLNLYLNYTFFGPAIAAHWPPASGALAWLGRLLPASGEWQVPVPRLRPGLSCS